MYAVVLAKTGTVISRHDTPEQAFRIKAAYENADGVEGILVPGTYAVTQVP